MANKTIKIGIIGFGRMGRFYLQGIQANKDYEVVYICDPGEASQKMAREMVPSAKVVSNEDEVFQDPTVDVVALCALANSRYEQIEKAFKYGKHIISEKPIADSREKEAVLVKHLAESKSLATVNLYLRNSWYHKMMKDFVKEGELGELAIIRVCHLTPGLAPGEGHAYEGPSFHDCGMHYVDIAKYHAESNFKTGRAQALRMWSWPEPWFLQAQGTFENGIIYDVTQGHVYGQMSKDQTHNSYCELIGTQGICRMTHDFKTAVVDLRGVTKTLRIEKPFGGKNIDTMLERLARSIRQGSLVEGLPTFQDAFYASETSWKLLDEAATHEMPCIGNNEELEAIRYRRAHMTNGYGLLHQVIK